MGKTVVALLAGIVSAIAAQTFVAIAETWSFGPSLAPLQAILGFATFPVVTAVSLGVPIGLLYFSVAKVLNAYQPMRLLALVAPFGLLQLVSVIGAGSGSKAYATFYAAAYVGMGIAGVVAQRRAAHGSHVISQRVDA